MAIRRFIDKVEAPTQHHDQCSVRLRVPNLHGEEAWFYSKAKIREPGKNYNVPCLQARRRNTRRRLIKRSTRYDGVDGMPAAADWLDC